MPTFDTPEPIHALVDVGGANVTVTGVARGRTTTVEIVPHSSSRAADVQQAERITVELVGARLTLRTPRTTKSRLRNLFGGSERVDIKITLPAASRLEVRGWGDVRTNGELGSVDIDTGMGEVVMEQTADVRARSGMGDVRLELATGPAELNSSMGSITVGRTEAAATVKTSLGDIRVEQGGGELRLSSSTGNVRVQRALAGVVASTPAGDILLNSVCSGQIEAKTSYGQLEIGIAHGSAAWLDVHTRHGSVRSSLEAADGPGESELTVQVRASVNYGDIVLRRA
ncbi:DUF4097 domain-containing protein [Kineosporia rhizophila]|uniref:DUF4097 family beta strand repeat-containing protein n=1 Tax=Kineosporia rhizophila TaxID=84633 RepID=UPI001E4B77C7|nr:DUF4097 family beta strand repeat-containing protein [Kineosporia rhizophila]MCE0534051.1 DUF4097 domain-containing protein [Kineosporia rhizophila]